MDNNTQQQSETPQPAPQQGLVERLSELASRMEEMAWSENSRFYSDYAKEIIEIYEQLKQPAPTPLPVEEGQSPAPQPEEGQEWERQIHDFALFCFEVGASGFPFVEHWQSILKKATPLQSQLLAAEQREAQLREALGQCVSRINPKSKDTWDLKAILVARKALHPSTPGTDKKY